MSHWQGRLFRVTPEGAAEKLIDTSVPGQYIADFGYQPDEHRIVAPTFYGDQLVAYDLPD